VTDTIQAESALATDLIGATAGLRRALKRRVGPEGGVTDLSDAQRELVRAVRLEPGSRIGDLAQTLQLAPNTVSTLATALISSGWLQRESDPTDARSSRLTLSDMASASVAEWRDLRASILTEYLERLPAADRRRIEDAVPAIRALTAILQDPA